MKDEIKFFVFFRGGKREEKIRKKEKKMNITVKRNAKYTRKIDRN